jgi:hypothetical protein
MTVRLSFGRNAGLPESVEAAWGARMIWPDDLVWDRQDMFGSAEQRKTLAEWLNGGALKAAREKLRELALEFGDWQPGASVEETLYEDQRGRVIGSPQGSHGYVYVAAWLLD